MGVERIRAIQDFDSARARAFRRSLLTILTGRAQRLRSLEPLLRAAGLEAAPADDLIDAMMQVSAWSRARESEGAPRILISGSLYLAGKVLRENS